MNLILSGVLFLSVALSYGDVLDPSQFQVFGMGVDPEFANVSLPVRYFYVVLVTKGGQKAIDYATDDDYVKVTVEGLKGTACRAWAHAINRHDGTFLVRYRLYNSCPKGLSITLTTSKGQPIAQSPYSIDRPVKHEGCDCPMASVKEFLTSYRCAKPSETLKESLKSWKRLSVNFTWVVDEVKQRFGKHPGAYSLCHYVVKRNRIYRNCYGQHVGFNMFSDAFLLSLTRKVILPDMEFFMNLGDWPLEKRRDNPIPIVSWCGSADTRDIILPTYDVTESTLEALGRQSLDMQSVQGWAKPKWSEKIPKAIWRGRDSRQERLDLVDISRSHPDLIDAKLTNFFFFKDQMDKYGPKAEYIPFGDFFHYKYQINVDGTVAAYRFPYLLAGNSLVFKQDSDYYEWFYQDLKPWMHYVPVKRDLSDLVEQLEWAKANDQRAQEIVRNAQDYAREHLQPMQIFCSHVRLLAKFSRILAAPPDQPGPEFHLVSQPEEKNPCDCPKTLKSASNGDRKTEL